VSETGEAGLDFANIKDAAGAHTLTNITVPTVTTLTGHTAQSGDTFALADGATGFAAIDTVVDSILLQTGTNGVKLADDAITSAKYDGSSAYPVAAADSGATQIARVGADGDTLKTLSDQLDDIPTVMVGTDGAALASVCTEGRLAELDEANLPTDIAAIPTTMVGTDDAALASVCTEGRLAELDAENLPTDIAAIPTTMVGTDDAALASVCSEDRLAELDAANLPADVADKAGYKLASDGLDSVATTAPAGVAANFREMWVQVWRRFFKKTTLTATELKTYADNGSSVVTTQAVSDDGTTQTQGASS